MLTKKRKTNKKTTRKIKLQINPLQLTVSPETPYKNEYKGFELEYKKLPFEKLSKILMNKFRKLDLPGEISPKNDFYSYVNQFWEKKTKVKKGQEYIVQLDNFRIVQDRVYYELLEIVEKYINEGSEKSIQMKNLYYSIKKGPTLKMLQNQALEISSKIDVLRENKENLWKFLGSVNRSGDIAYAVPFHWSLDHDYKKSNILRCYINPPKLTLDLNVYFDDGTHVEYKKKYKIAYFDYLNKLFRLFFGDNHKMNVKDVFDVEVEILMAMGCNVEEPSYHKPSYYKITAKQALKEYGFNWTEFAYALGFTYVPDFITSQLSYLRCGTKLLIEKWNSNKWRTYWIYILIRHLVRISPEYCDIYYDFMGKYMMGQAGQLDRKILPIFTLGYAYSSFLNNQYIEKYEKIETIKYLTNMVYDLKEVFTKIIQDNKWMQPKTKKNALLKLKHLKINVGTAKETVEDPDWIFDINDPLQNLKNIVEWKHRKIIELEGKEYVDILTIDWSVIPPKFIGNQSYIVNANYRYFKNDINIHLAYIQKPFIDLEERGIEYNLSQAGFTIAHEMSHALDNTGDKYDYKGNYNNWFTSKDEEIFNKIQKNVNKQYEIFAARDGITIDASLSIGENIADISALQICNQYLGEFQEKNEDIYTVRKLSFQAFYLYYAYQMRQKISKRSLQSLVNINVHSLDKYRTNIPLSRLSMFKYIYDIQKGDLMYWEGDKLW